MKKLLFIFSFFLAQTVFCQTTLWGETFNSYANGTENGTAVGAAPTNWYTTLAGDVWVQGGRIEANNLPGEGQWFTDPINITNYTDINFFLTVATGNANAFEAGQDYFIGEYRVDGGAWVVFENASGDSSPFDPLQSSYSVNLPGTGSTLELRIRLFNNANNEVYYFDNVAVQGTFIPDSDGDGVNDSEDVCDGQDDNADFDADGVPDGCDLDGDNDGITDADEGCPPPSLLVNDGVFEPNFFPNNYWAATYFEGNNTINGTSFGNTGGNGQTNDIARYRGESYLGLNQGKISFASNGSQPNGSWSALETPTDPVLPDNYVGATWASAGNPHYRIRIRRKAFVDGNLIIGGPGQYVDDAVEVFVNAIRQFAVFPGSATSITTANSIPISAGDNVTIVFQNMGSIGGFSLEIDFPVIDTDGDNLMDCYDLDADNDGIYDVVEAGGADPDNNGIIGTGASSSITDTNANGWSDIADNSNGGTLLPDTDSDTDGNPDRVELDADADGCNDALEAGFTDDDTDGLLGNSPVTVDANGVVTSGVDGYTGTSSFVTDPALQSGCLIPTDNDDDGIFDSNDLDDDNDGITDVEESSYRIDFGNNYPCTNDVAFTSSNNFSSTLSNTNSLNQGQTNTWVFTRSVSNFSFGVMSLDQPASYGAITINYEDGSSEINADFNIKNRTDWTPEEVAWVNTMSAANSVTDIVKATIGSDIVFNEPSTQQAAGIITFNTTKNVTSFSIKNTTTSSLSGGTVFTFFGIIGCDSDRDGLINSIDLDSDNDGCFDVTEAGHNDDNGDGILGPDPVTVDGDGLVTSGPGGYSGTDALVTDPSMVPPGCANDNDVDGVTNAFDLDDDNDGITDAQEYDCPSGGTTLYVLWSLNDTPRENPTTINSTILSNADPLVLGSGMTDVSGSARLQLSGVDQADLAGAMSDQDYVDFSFTTAADAPVVDFDQFRFRKTSGTPLNYEYDITILISDDNFTTYQILMQDEFIDGTGINTNIPLILTGSPYLWLSNTDYTVRVYFYAHQNPGNSVVFDDISLRGGTCGYTSDIDGDGIPNQNDLDSDNDGCFDVTEAGFTDNNGDGILGPNPVTVDGDGLVTSGSGGYSGTDALVTDPSMVPPGCGDDNDSDGVTDVFDLDDDNDGITDVEESSYRIDFGNNYPCTNDVAFTSSNNFSSTLSNTNSLNQGQTNTWVFTRSVSNFSFGVMSLDQPASYGAITINYEDGTSEINADFNIKNRTDWTPEELAWVNTMSAQNSVTDILKTTIGSDIVFNEPSGQQAAGIITFNTTKKVTSFSIKNTTTSSLSGGTVFTFFGIIGCDSDGDGLINSIDLDSDGDGCFDALEGNAPETQIGYTELNPDGSIAGAVDANGIPTTATGGQAIGTSIDASQQAAECSPCDVNNPEYTDIDGDLVGDFCDLDNDNDGILDTDEKDCSGFVPIDLSAITNLSNSSINNQPISAVPFATSFSSAITTNHTSTVTTRPLGLNNGDLRLIQGNNTEISEYRIDFDHPTSVQLSQAELNGAFEQLETWTIVTNGGAISVNNPVIDVVTDNGTVWNDTELQNITGNLTNTVTFSPKTAFSDGNISVADSEWSLTAVQVKSLTIRLQTESPANNASRLKISANCVSLDTDGDGIPDHLDLDADGDGCNDVNEAGFTDDNNDGLLGPSPVVVDGDGLVISGSNGYTTPADADSNGTYDFQEAGTAPAFTNQPVDINLCPGCSGAFSATLTNADTFQWQIFNGTDWDDLTNTGIYSNTTTAMLTLSEVTPADNGNRYRLLVSSTTYSCTELTSNEVTLTTRINTVITNRQRTYRIKKN